MMRLAASVDPSLRRETRRESRRARRMVPVTVFRGAIVFVKSVSGRTYRIPRRTVLYAIHHYGISPFRAFDTRPDATLL